MPNFPSNPTAHEVIAGCPSLAGDLATQYARRWLVVDDTGAWVSAHDAPALAQIETTLRYGYLALRAPGMLRMDIPLEVEEDDDSVARSVTVGTSSIPVVDEGDFAAAWLSNFLQRPCRLVKRHPPEVAVAWPDCDA